ncbi:Aste57867_24268 [Aphanomyces stellatus]|uniref:Aste57867_24268 protein n=1 Tax=Aphanomyces stellatus TaxID=120398 RepID=A0A485LQQ4_9STRA|nr:hypothetical protein As57867_024193 [Aphanomyces stellatus]VFU00908.1 Aste57867_24268 [Aphanomyces stellatus]
MSIPSAERRVPFTPVHRGTPMTHTSWQLACGVKNSGATRRENEPPTTLRPSMSQNQEHTAATPTRLPDIYASPGNVGVQIDSYRNKGFYDRPRCTKFTTAFHGFMFEDNTLKNAKRMLAREVQRKRDEEERMKKLADYQATRLEAKVRHEEKRKHREYIRKQRVWEHQQAMKAASQRAAETTSALKIQAFHRGSRVRKRVAEERQAATAIQSHLRRFTARKTYLTQVAARRERQRTSATKIQSHMRRRLSAKRVQAMKAKRMEDVVRPDEMIVPSLDVLEIQSPRRPTPDTTTASTPLPIASTKETESRTPDSVATHTPSPPPSTAKKTQDFILKRVGGGFRRIFKAKPPPSSSDATSPTLLLSPSRSSSSSPMPSTPSKATVRLPKPPPPKRSFLQHWNEVTPPVAKSLESFIHDPNLAEKLKFTMAKSPASPAPVVADAAVVCRVRDATELCQAMDDSFPIAEHLDQPMELAQSPLEPADVMELRTAIADMVSLDETPPERLDEDQGQAVPCEPDVLPTLPLLRISTAEKPPSRPEVADEGSIFQWMPQTILSTAGGEWTELLDGDFDVKGSWSQEEGLDDVFSDDRVEPSRRDGHDDDDIDGNAREATPEAAVKPPPKSILKKPLPPPIAPVVVVGSQFRLRKESHHPPNRPHLPAMPGQVYDDDDDDNHAMQHVPRCTTSEEQHAALDSYTAGLAQADWGLEYFIGRQST